MLEQKRSRSMMKKAKVPAMKRSTMVKLKRMLTECLMEKNILEGRGGGSDKYYKGTDKSEGKEAPEARGCDRGAGGTGDTGDTEVTEDSFEKFKTFEN